MKFHIISILLLSISCISFSQTPRGIDQIKSPPILNSLDDRDDVFIDVAFDSLNNLEIYFVNKSSESVTYSSRSLGGNFYIEWKNIDNYWYIYPTTPLRSCVIDYYDITVPQDHFVRRTFHLGGIEGDFSTQMRVVIVTDHGTIKSKIYAVNIDLEAVDNYQKEKLKSEIAIVDKGYAAMKEDLEDGPRYLIKKSRVYAYYNRFAESIQLIDSIATHFPHMVEINFNTTNHLNF